MNKSTLSHAPRWATRLLRWFCAPHRLDELEGDLDELFQERVKVVGLPRARWRYVRDVLSLMRPSMIKRQPNDYPNPANSIMLRNYLKIAFRNLAKNRVYSSINMFGLASGMAVAMLIGLWIQDELTFNKYFQHYDRLARVMQYQTYNGVIESQLSVPIPLAQELRTTYSSDFDRVVVSSWTQNHILSAGETKVGKSGIYMQPEAPDLLSLTMLRGTRAGLKNPTSILLAESTAKALFGEADPMGKIVKIDNKLTASVTGVYADIPYATQFNDLLFIAPFDLWVSSENWLKKATDNWSENSFQTFVQLSPNADYGHVSAKIKDIRLAHSKADASLKPELFLHPMSKWHLYSEFKNGANTGGLIQFVWLFGIVGLFVLLLACINFMNLSTARSEKRAKEVGIRKAVGSRRQQLVSQFFTESFLVVFLAFGLAIGLVTASLGSFNQLADKQMAIPWLNPIAWLIGLGVVGMTGLLAGSYPALYLSSFQPIKVLKGRVNVGPFAAIPRKVLVVVQFVVSVSLIIGTFIVYNQIQFAKNRPVGYNRNGLLEIRMKTPDFYGKYDLLRTELRNTGAVTDMAEASTPVTDVWQTSDVIDWPGKDPNTRVDFATVAVTYDFGKTMGWQFNDGRDFSKAFGTDSSGVVLNQSAAKLFGLNNRQSITGHSNNLPPTNRANASKPTTSPIGQTIRWDGQTLHVIGVVEDMVMQSPYNSAKNTLFYVNASNVNWIFVRINPSVSVAEAMPKIESVFKKMIPSAPFDYRFVDQEYAHKFGTEERIGNLTTVFAGLAIFISCLGLFGLSSFMAEARTKEIGVRKVLGASVLNLWGLLSKDFVVLVVIAFVIATPIAYYILGNWLHNYEYRTELAWWVFAASGAGALLVTLLTVSYQSIKAALMNPIKSLRSE
ncbi:ABC transporter permease [Spirosoma horti]